MCNQRWPTKNSRKTRQELFSSSYLQGDANLVSWLWQPLFWACVDGFQNPYNHLITYMGIYLDIWSALILALLLWIHAYEIFHKFLISKNLTRYKEFSKTVLIWPRQFPKHKVMYQCTAYAQANPPYRWLSGQNNFGIHPHMPGIEAVKVWTLGLHHPLDVHHHNYVTYTGI